MKFTQTKIWQKVGNVLLQNTPSKVHPDMRFFTVDGLSIGIQLIMKALDLPLGIQLGCLAVCSICIVLPLFHDWKYVFGEDQVTYVEEDRIEETRKYYLFTFSLRLLFLAYMAIMWIAMWAAYKSY